MEGVKNDEKKALIKTGTGHLLTKQQFQELAEVPAEVEWFANINNKRTRRAYQIDVTEFMGFVGIRSPVEFRRVTRSHLIVWRKSLEEKGVTGATIRRKLACLSSLFEYSIPKWRATRARHQP